VTSKADYVGVNCVASLERVALACSMATPRPLWLVPIRLGPRISSANSLGTKICVRNANDHQQDHMRRLIKGRVEIACDGY
jgi:hypothetical protein